MSGRCRSKVLAAISILFLAVGCLPEWDGRSIDEILPVPAEDATVEDLEMLSRHDVFQLFYAAFSPELSTIEGEYKAKLISPDVFSDFYAHNLMGPGHWEGKAFLPLGENEGWGYNLFEVEEDGESRIVRVMKMDTYTGKSRFDDKDSMHLVYAAYNEGLNNSMHDDIRKINDELLLGLGTVSWSLGSLNPMPFAVYGSPDPWIGPDEP